MKTSPYRFYLTSLLLGAGLIAWPATSRSDGDPRAEEPNRHAGTVLAVDGDSVVLDLGGEPSIAPGTVLALYRRVPGGRGPAKWRSDAPWDEVGEVAVESLQGTTAIGRQISGPKTPLPSLASESGALPDHVQVGDRVRTTGAIGARAIESRVVFARADLFDEGPGDFGESGERTLRHWLDGLVKLDGPIVVEVITRSAPESAPPIDSARELSAQKSAPLGARVGEFAVPIESLWDDPARPLAVPPGREAQVVSTGARPESWLYADSVTLALRDGERVAEALSARLSLPPGSIRVRVLPRDSAPEGPVVRGFDPPGDQVRILGAGLQWEEPKLRPKGSDESKPEPSVQEERVRRRPLERTPDAS